MAGVSVATGGGGAVVAGGVVGGAVVVTGRSTTVVGGGATGLASSGGGRSDLAESPDEVDDVDDVDDVEHAVSPMIANATTPAPTRIVDLLVAMPKPSMRQRYDNMS